MPGAHPGRQLLLRLVRRDDDEIDLIRAALAIAWEDVGTLDVEHHVRLLDALTARVGAGMVTTASPGDQAEYIVEYLGEVEGFTGDTTTYDDPANSYLSEVLDRRKGLPITLALVLLHVGWGLGMPFEPAALPGHFMVRCADPGGSLFLDLFYGRVLDIAQCRAFLRDQLGYEVPNPERFPVPSRRQVLARLLRNLKRSYVQRDNFQHALAVTDRILVMEPASSEDVRDRGLLRARLHDLHRALVDLERYAAMEPLAADQALIRKHARAIMEIFAQRN